MASKVKSIPKGWHSVTPFLCVKDAARAIEFYSKAFGATELQRIEEPDGKVNHALLKIGDSMVRLSDDSSKHVAEWVASYINLLRAFGKEAPGRAVLSAARE